MPGADVGHRGVVIDRLGVNRFDDGDVVDDLGGPRHKLADPGSGFAVLLEFVLRRSDGKTRLTAGHGGQALAHADGFGQVLIEHLGHRRLVVEQIHLRRAFIHE